MQMGQYLHYNDFFCETSEWWNHHLSLKLKGVLDRDPLSQLLFIVAMEAL